MDLIEAVRRRRMVRSFTAQPLDEDEVLALLDLGRRAPSAGHTAGRAFLLLEGVAASGYWDASLPPGPGRDAFAWPGLVQAPALVVVLASPSAYTERYAEADKAATGLGADADAWPVPYWFVDGGLAVEAILLGAVAAGLGACFFGLFDREAAVLAALGVPNGWRAVGTIALGHPSDEDRPGRSVARERPTLDQIVHRGRW